MKKLVLHLGHYITSALCPWILAPRPATFSKPVVPAHEPCAPSAIGAFFIAGLALALTGARAWGQQYAIDGGFEAVTADPVVSATGDVNLWTREISTLGAYCIPQTTTPRTGGKCMELKISSLTSHGLQTKRTKFNSVTHIVVQYYYKDSTNQAGTPFTKAGIKYGGVQKDGSSSAGRATDWTKKTDLLTVSGTSASTDFALVKVGNSQQSTMSDYYIDDVAVYDGTAVDETPPDAPSSPSVAVLSSTSLTVSWTAPATGVDGGGYLVVRGSSDPATTPNVNGIYVVSNTVASGQTVVYIGIETSFLDSGLTTGSTYFYRIYTFDKAFNYSPAAGGGAVSGKPDTGCTPPTITLEANPAACAGATSANLSYGATSGSPDLYSIVFDAAAHSAGFTDVTLASLPAGSIAITLPGAAPAAAYYGTLTVKNTTTGCTSSGSAITVTVNAPPVAATDTYNRMAGLSLKINKSELLGNDTAGSTFAGLPNLATANNVTLAENDTTILYPASAPSSQDDSFTYTIAGPNGCTANGTVNIHMLSGVSGGQVQTINANGGSVIVNFVGVPGCAYQVQRATVLEGGGNWADVGSPITVLISDSPPGVFSYTDSTPPSTAYYRLKYVGVTP